MSFGFEPARAVTDHARTRASLLDRMNLSAQASNPKQGTKCAHWPQAGRMAQTAGIPWRRSRRRSYGSSLVALISVAGLGIVSSPANGSVRAGDDSPESRYCWIAQSLGGQRAGGRSCYAATDLHE